LKVILLKTNPVHYDAHPARLLYTPTVLWQLGQVWCTSFRVDTQQGIKQPLKELSLNQLLLFQ